MAAQYELLSQLLKSGGRLDMGQELFYKFYQAFVLKDRWLQYIGGVGTTLLVTAIALARGVLLGSVGALVRVAHDQQRPGRRNPVLGVVNAVCQVYTTVIRGTPMMVQAMGIYWGYAYAMQGQTLPLIPSGIMIVSVNTGGGVAEIVSRCGSNVVSVLHDGSDPNMPISSCFLKLTLETRDNAQIEQIRQELTKAGFQLVAERV